MRFPFFSRSRDEAKANPVASINARGISGIQMVVPGRSRQVAEEVDNSTILTVAVDKIAASAASVPWVMVDANGKAITNHPVLKLLERPTPQHSRHDFMKLLFNGFVIHGNAFATPVRGAGGIIELWPLRADRIEFETNRGTGELLAYRYKVGGSSGKPFPVDSDGLSKELMHIRRVDWRDDHKGKTALTGAVVPAAIHHTHQVRHNSVLSGESVIPGILHTEVELTEDQFEAVQEELRQFRVGGDKTGKWLILAGAKWGYISAASDPASLVSTEAKNDLAREVCNVLGIPPMLLGIPGDNTFSNYQEARLAFYEDTLIPGYLDPVGAGMSNWFSRVLGEEIKLVPDVQSIPAMRNARRSYYSSLEGLTYLSPNEKRAEAGYEPVEGGDEVFVSSGMIPLSLASDPDLLKPAPAPEKEPPADDEDQEDEDEAEDEDADEDADPREDDKSFALWLDRQGLDPQLAKKLVSK